MRNGDGEDIIQILSQDLQNGIRWTPVIGHETTELFQNVGLPRESQIAIRDEAVMILSRCIPPTEEHGQETGLVVGYIQSGKTLSFTTVAALARDNNYPMVIVIAGTSIPLNYQSHRRLREDLQLDTRQDRAWRHIHNPRIEDNSNTIISNILAEWADETVPQEERVTILITVMKHHDHLNHLIRVLQLTDLNNIPVLIVDDEADQAGLNNLITEGEESTTYHRLRILKDTIPHHTFLQYTATPQGPLLINLIDVLSPRFAVTLTAGDQYVGGCDFFGDDDEPLIREIPPHEISTRNNPLIEPPESLMQALKIFFLGVAIGLVRDRGRGNRSMMIHPSRRTTGHGHYFTWTNGIKESWTRILQNQSDPDFTDLIDDFRESYNDLHNTVDDLEAFEDIVPRLLHAIRRTELHLVNATRGRTPQIGWSDSYSHILVGGQALDRGFTVEGLTVTYMPRGVGARRADTVHQRARFFGYKRAYLGFCRIYLEREVADAFRRYVLHEEYIRNRIDENSHSGRPLTELRRAFLIPRRLVPTRDSIIDIDYVRARFNEGWFYPRAPHEAVEFVENNLRVINDFTQTLDFVPDEGNPSRTRFQTHQVVHNVPLEKIYNSLIINLRFARLSDAQNMLGIIVILRGYLEREPGAELTIYNMSCGTPRNRGLNNRQEISNLFQGAAPVNPPEERGNIYPGDRAIRNENGVTIQLHTLDIQEFSERNPDFPIVPNIAIWIPREIVGDVIIQNQGNIEEYYGE